LRIPTSLALGTPQVDRLIAVERTLVRQGLQFRRLVALLDGSVATPPLPVAPSRPR
jgi:hypothetical protein